MAANQFAIQLGENLTNEAHAFGMGATRPHNPAARGELLGATASWQNRSGMKKNKPALNTKLRILPSLVQCRIDFDNAKPSKPMVNLS